jgi:hypothetical protein
LSSTLHNIDRAAVVAVAAAQILETALPQERLQQLEDYLRDEFEDERRQAIADLEPADA